MTLILGMNLGHDGSVALVKNGKLIGAIAKERLTRVKKDTGVTVEMVDYVLRMVGATIQDVDAVGFAGYDYSPDNEVKLFHPTTGAEIVNNIYDLDFYKGAETCTVRIGDVERKGYYVQHHLSHCASAFFTSPFEKAACFSLDASGRNAPEASSIFAIGQGQHLLPFYCPGLMIGNEYSELTARLGLGPGLHKAGTLMGLAGYGKVAGGTIDKIPTYAKSWYERAMQPSEQAFVEKMWVDLSGRPPLSGFDKSESDGKAAMDIAATFQHIFEEVIVQYANRLYAETDKLNGDNLCLSGGSFLNCNVNTEILKRTPFKRVHLFPACGDDGTAVGSALFLAHFVANEPRSTYLPVDIAFLGRHYDVPSSWATQPLNLMRVANNIALGNVVAWFQGRSEFGPRALGHRSILADPRSSTMRDRINSNVKHREWFRPFAPSVLYDQTKEWFDFPEPSPFMLHTANVKQATIPAVTHIDGTARHQTVDSDNITYYNLIKEFYKQTNVPMLLNTSLNNNNEPLVESPADLMRFWEKTPEVSVLVMNNQMIMRSR